MELIAASVEWLSHQVAKLRAAECPDAPQVNLTVHHATVKVAAGQVVRLIIQVQPTNGGEAWMSKARSVAEDSSDADFVHHNDTETGFDHPGVFHEALVLWEFTTFRHIRDKLLDGEEAQVFLSTRGRQPGAPRNGTSGKLLPSAVLGVSACGLLGESTFNIGTLPAGEEEAPGSTGEDLATDDAQGEEHEAGPDGMADANATAAADRGETVDSAEPAEASDAEDASEDADAAEGDDAEGDDAEGDATDAADAAETEDAPATAFVQTHRFGYLGFEKGHEHVDLIPPTVPRAMRKLALVQQEQTTLPRHHHHQHHHHHGHYTHHHALLRKHVAHEEPSNETADAEAEATAATEQAEESEPVAEVPEAGNATLDANETATEPVASAPACPEVCVNGSRHFADIFFSGGDDSCYETCECSHEASYASLCNKCCQVHEDGNCTASEPVEDCEDVPVVPEAFDLRQEHPACFPSTIVEDQGMCGSCFAFATLGSTADRLCVKDRSRLIDAKGYRHLLSVQQFLSCNGELSDADSHGFPGLVVGEKWGCGGGYFLAASHWLVANGATLQDHYPYTSKCVLEGGVVNQEEGFERAMLAGEHKTCAALEKWLPRDLLPCACQGHSGNQRKCVQRDTQVQVESVYRLPNVNDLNEEGSNYAHEEVVKMMQVDLMTEGSLYAAFKVYEDFDGFFESDPMAVYEHRWGRQVGGHAIIIVGWGESADGTPYWLIRNSWGTNWGDGGHFRIKRGSNECGIESRVWGSGLFVESEAEDPRPKAVNPHTLYGFVKGRTYAGNDLREVEPKSLAYLKEVCKFDDACVGFDSTGILKEAFPKDEKAWLDLPTGEIEHGDREGTSIGGFYTKLTRESVLVTIETGGGSMAEGPLEVYLCTDAKNGVAIGANAMASHGVGGSGEAAENSVCAVVPVELQGLVPGQQKFRKDAWLPVHFALSRIEVYNRDSVHPWLPSGPMHVEILQPGHKAKKHVFNIGGQTFSPNAVSAYSAGWKLNGATGLLLTFCALFA